MNAPFMCANIVTEDPKEGVWKKKVSVLSDPIPKSTAHETKDYEDNKENIGPKTVTKTNSIDMCESRSKVLGIKAKYRSFAC